MAPATGVASLAVAGGFALYTRIAPFTSKRSVAAAVVPTCTWPAGAARRRTRSSPLVRMAMSTLLVVPMKLMAGLVPALPPIRQPGPMDTCTHAGMVLSQ